jgi:hypothetical protein
VHRRSWRLGSPELIDEDIPRDDLVRMKEQKREQCPLLVPAERKRPIFVLDVERAENSKKHAASRLSSTRR